MIHAAHAKAEPLPYCSCAMFGTTNDMPARWPAPEARSYAADREEDDRLFFPPERTSIGAVAARDHRPGNGISAFRLLSPRVRMPAFSGTPRGGCTNAPDLGTLQSMADARIPLNGSQDWTTAPAESVSKQKLGHMQPEPPSPPFRRIGAPVRATAIEHIRPLPGGSRSHLLRADDGHFYVVKFLNNPQGRRVLVNEYIATRLAALLGLPVPEIGLIHVLEPLIRYSPAMRMTCGDLTVMCSAGLQFGSRLCGDPQQSVLLDFLPKQAHSLLQNPDAVFGAYVFDRWTGNIDRRQFVFVRTRGARGIRACLIDQGFCFGGEDWRFRDAPRDGLAADTSLYQDLRSWKQLEPWIQRIEAMPFDCIRQAADELPHSWNGAPSALDSLLRALDTRRQRLRALISESLAMPNHPFVNWNVQELLPISPMLCSEAKEASGRQWKLA